MSDNNDFNESGYRKPPQHNQFKKGQSGNPQGRPKGRSNLVTVLKKTLREKVVITENGQRKTVTKLQAAVKQLVNKAAAGDLHAMQQLAVLALSRVEDSAEASGAEVSMTEADQKALQGILRRFEANFQGDEDAKSDSE